MTRFLPLLVGRLRGPMETQPGKKLGRYEVVAELGRGAMGVVYKALDPKIDRFVAVKTISLAGQSADEEREYRERFFLEAQAAGRLVHPGIVTVFDVGEDNESRDPFIVMEYIPGQSLNRLLSGENKKLPLNQALRLAEEVADALDYAHAQGVVHRDIKPANILITEDGHAKIADFGIAKLNVAHLTLPGQVLGTPAYMAPEQLEGEAVDGRSDLFSLGVILYSMVTGYRPFQGNSATTVCFKVVNREPVPVTALNPGLPPELDAVIGHAMAKDPAQRYQKGGEFARDLRALHGRTSMPSSEIELLETVASTMDHRGGQTSSSRNFGPRTAADSRPTRAAMGVVHSVRLVRVLAGTVPAVPLLVGAALLLAFIFVGIRVGRPPAAPPAMAPAQNESTSHAQPSVVTNAESATAMPAHVVPAQPPGPGVATRNRRTAPYRQDAKPKTQTERSQDDEASVSELRIEVEHHFTDAELSVSVDDTQVYTQSLRGEDTKHLVVFRGVRGSEHGKIKVPAGKHHLQVRIRSGDESFDESKTISAQFVEGVEKTLRVAVDKHNKEMKLTLQ
jgi:serine/threonine protein kinase